MARQNLQAALGREAVFSDKGAKPAPSRPATDSGRGATTATWEETHSRSTFHLSRELRDAIAEAAAKTGRSKSQIVTDALRQHLKLDSRG